MQKLYNNRNSSWEPDVEYFQSVVAQAIIFKKAEQIARKHGFPAYRANAVTYTVALLSYRTAGRIPLTNIWNHQEVPSALAATLHDWMPIVYESIIDSAGGRNITEWCKQEECWRHLQTI